MRIPRGTTRALHALATAAVAGGVTGWLAPAAQIPWPIAAAAAFAVTVLLPRLGWLVTLAGVTGAILFAPEGTPASGTALAVAAAALPVPCCLWRAPRAWSLAAMAPALGLAGVGGAFPAVAGRLATVWERAALGALGAWWIELADPDRSGLNRSADAIAAFFTGGQALTLLIWAAAAAVLPWLVRGRYLVLDVAAAAAWSAALASATASLAAWRDVPEPTGLVAAALAAGTIAVLMPRYWTE